MFGFWLPIGLLIASLGLFGIAIARRHNRMTAETYRLSVFIWSIAVLTLGLGFGWSSYQMEQTLGRFENVKAKADVLQKHIKAAEGQLQLMHFADPLQEDDPIALQNYRRVQASSIRDDDNALTQEVAEVRSQFDEFTQVRMQRDFTLFLCVLGLASALTAAAICRDVTHRRHVDESAGRL